MQRAVGGGDHHVAVIGGGIAGLAAAHALVSTKVGTTRVTVFEAASRLGGMIRTSPFGGIAVDEGADAFLARVPWATQLAASVGLEPDLVTPDTARAAVWWDGLHPVPDGLLLGMPTDILAMARSPLLSWAGKLRAATEPLRRRTDLGADSLGGYVRARFGNEVHFRLVDPLVGSIYAADTDHFSLAAVPQIAELANRARSVLLAARHRPPAPPGPLFLTPADGMETLVQRTAADVRALGGDIRTGATVTALERDGSRWRVEGSSLDAPMFDAVVLACPARRAAALTEHSAPETARLLQRIPTADVALVTLAVDAGEWPTRLRHLSGYLVPKPRQRLVTAVSFGSQKWQRWASPDRIVMRISLGRDGLPVLHLGDDELRAAALDDVGRHLGMALSPTEVRISRWPGAFPQYRPHHARLVADAEAALPAGVSLAGASYHGIGIPACVRSGTEAGGRALEHLRLLAE